MEKLGGWSIQQNCYEFLIDSFPHGSTLLELGSGLGTQYLSQHFIMYSIENYPEWIGRYNSTYIYAPLKFYSTQWTTPNLPSEYGTNQTAWYDPNKIKGNLPKKYDAILIDGPNGKFGRGGFLKHLELFNTNVMMIFDDINRLPEFELMKAVSLKIERPYYILDKYTGYII